MGDFFTSPHEKASTNLYNMALAGRPLFDATRIGNLGRQALVRSGETLGATTSRDILSQGTSAGIPLQSILNRISSTRTGIAGKTAEQMPAITTAELNATLQSLEAMMQAGLGGMSKSSTFGDIMAGLTTAANIASGVATAGGSSGFGWWKG